MLTPQEIAFVPSVQHTGTWFTLNFLKPFFPGGTRELTRALDVPQKPDEDAMFSPSYSHPITKPTLLHVHLPINDIRYFDDYFADSLFHRRWHFNLLNMRSQPVQTILLFANMFKTVIPIRDPMAAILSREARHPQFRHFYIVDGYVALAKEFARHPNVCFLPVDSTDEPGIRRSLVLNVMEHVGIDTDDEDTVNYVDRFVEAWEPQNVTPGNRFKPFYESGDLEAIQYELGPKWAEVEYLRNMGSIIIPFMASLGYTRERLKF